MTPFLTLAIIFYGLAFVLRLTAIIIDDRERKGFILGAATAFSISGLMILIVWWVTK